MGPHDANFHGNQLRLSAFLRIIGDGLPPRPTRCNRRATAEENRQMSRDCASIPIDKIPLSRASPVADVHTLLPDAGDEEPEECRRLTSVSSNSLPPRPETPMTQRQAKAAKAPTRNQGSSHTRKRRLPVNELALLRTTSSRGLPHPSDAESVLATHVTDNDPIEDSQVVSVAVPRNRRTTLGSHKLSSCQTNRSSPIRLMKNVLGRLQNIPRQDRQRELRLNPVSDGFVGAELDIKSRNKQAMPRRKVRTELRKRISVGRGLALTAGALPVPTKDQDEDRETWIPMERSHIERPQSPLKTACTVEDIAKPVQPVVTVSRNAKVEEHPRNRRSPREEVLVMHQLSCVTAPFRHDSESSDSEMSEEDHSMNDEDESDADEVTSWAPSVYLTRTPTISDETSYFENAMYSLGVVDTTDSV